MDSEEQFKKLAIKKGWKVIDSSKDEDMFMHIDVFLERDSNRLGVDVKSPKKLSRHGGIQDEWTWMEFKNVRGNNGWLYGSADVIAFDRVDKFLIVSRKHLADLSERLIDKTQIVSRPWEAKYKAYKRFDRPDELVGMIQFKDIMSLKNKVWIK